MLTLDRHDSAGVIAPPPVLFGSALIIALLLNALRPLAIARTLNGLLWAVAVASIGTGLMLSIAVVRAFRAAGTPVTPRRGTARVVSTGPYRYSRNPDYIGQMLMYLGIALLMDSWWPFVLLPLVLVTVQRGVIRREERYLESKFGDEYRDYMARVRRWL